MTIRAAPLTAAAIAVLACAGAPAPAPDARPVPSRGRSPAAAPAPDLGNMLADDLARDHGFPWSATRRLAWSDFEGEPPAQDDKSARTAYGLFYGWHCRGHAMTFSVITGFRRRGSWVKPLVHRNPAESARVLRHEQTHFDIAEVYARRMRRTFAALENPCGKSDGALHAVARDILEAEKTEQRRYDAETRHSLVIERQQAWERDVARLLESLDRYAR